MRDAIQSLIATKCSADEILDAYANAHLIGTATIQTGGGTFFDIFARDGRNEWEEVEKLLTHFKKKNIRQTALVRGDCLFGYRPQPFSVVLATVREYAAMGMNVLQNFHGLNDVRLLEGVAEAVRQVRDRYGFDIVAQGTICIENNPNVTIDRCLETAQLLIDAGHEGFYLKSASGWVEPDFIYKLTAALIDNFGEQTIDVHIHSTYGKAPIGYFSAITAAIERNHPIGVDVQHPAMSGSTAHPSMLKMASLIRNHPNGQISRNAPDLNTEAITADRGKLLELRFRYRGFEASYNDELLAAMRGARAPGGATSTLKNIPGLVQNLTSLIEKKTGKKPSWDEIQIAVYEMQAKLLGDLGEPTQVTPYAFNTTQQAALSLVWDLQGKDPLSFLTPETKDYLTGDFGRVPHTVSPVLLKRALAAKSLEKPTEYTPSHLTPDNALEKAKKKLRSLGIKRPTDQQAISVVMRKDGHDHVVTCFKGRNNPAPSPSQPSYIIQEGQKIKGNNIFASNMVNILGGIAKLEHIAQCALFLKQLDDGLNQFPSGLEWKREEWHQKLIHELTNFINQIPKLLEEAGIRSFKKEFSTELGRQFTMQEVIRILRDIIDHRGKGLFDHMIGKLKVSDKMRELCPAFTNFDCV